VPSATDPKTFFCYTPLQQGFIITGYVFSAISTIFSIYKLRIFVQERMQKLKEANITPTVRRIIFLERTLANHSKHLMLSLPDRAGTLDETRSSSDEAVVPMVRDVQRQFEEQSKQQQEQSKQQQEQLLRKLEQQQEQQEQLKQQLQEQLKQQQQQIHQLMQQLQRSQQ
jgi:predicted ribosome quality control (RQC) complex YloA/Tae2 family protein